MILSCFKCMDACAQLELLMDFLFLNKPCSKANLFLSPGTFIPVIDLLTNFLQQTSQGHS